MKKFNYWLLLATLIIGINLANATAPTNNAISPTKPKTEITTTIPVEKEKTIAELREEVKPKRDLISPITVFANLLTLIIIMVVLAWLYNRYGKTTLSKVIAVSKTLNKNSISILSTTPIGQHNYLHVIEVDNERLLIGATNNNIALIKELKPLPKDDTKE